MSEAPGAGETEGTRTRGSIARRMLITAAVWSSIVLIAAGWSLQALYRAETDRQLDVANNQTLVSLANAVVSNDGRLSFNETKWPRDELYDMAFKGKYWAYLFLDEKHLIVDAEQSESFADSRPEISAEMISAALSRPGFIVHENTQGPVDRPLRVALQALTFTDRDLPILLYSSLDRTAADEAVRRFALTLGIALGVLALGIVVGVLVLIRYGLRPLHEIQDKLHDVRAGRRDRLDGEYPRELTPLVKEIDTLINHNRKVVERARTHVGNLAHALKTPLAVLRNEARGDDRVSEIVRRQTDAMTS